jgi:hypothetical protein
MAATTSTPTTTKDDTGTSYTELNALLDRMARPNREPLEITDAQLLALQHRWTAALSACLDQTLELGGTEQLADAVAQTWRRLADEQPTLRAVLDHHEAGSAALTNGQRTELWMLAMAAGLVGVDEPADRAAVLGRALRELIRAGHTTRVAELVA